MEKTDHRRLHSVSRQSAKIPASQCPFKRFHEPSDLPCGALATTLLGDQQKIRLHISELFQWRTDQRKKPAKWTLCARIAGSYWHCYGQGLVHSEDDQSVRRTLPFYVFTTYWWSTSAVRGHPLLKRRTRDVDSDPSGEGMLPYRVQWIPFRSCGPVLVCGRNCTSIETLRMKG